MYLGVEELVNISCIEPCSSLYHWTSYVYVLIWYKWNIEKGKEWCRENKDKF